MTIENAIKCIDSVLSSTLYFDDSLAYELTTDDVEWLETAKKVLEMRLSKKPEPYNNDAFWKKCPNCKSFAMPISDFCKYCGQALDWSDEE